MPPRPDDSRLPRIPRERGEDHAPDVVARRRRLCEGVRGVELPHLAGEPVPSEIAAGNIENMIGYAQVPVGIAGPLVVDTSDGVREVYVPMATNEGAMVASYSRGMRLLSEGGGARARVLSEGLSQHPILVYANASDAVRAGEAAVSAIEEWRVLTAEITRHGALVRVEPQVLGRRLVVRLVFTTGDAIGINMAANATDRIARMLAERTGALARYVHGQDVEKRANARALVEGRGRSVVAEAVVSRAALASVARVAPEDLVQIARTYAVGYAQLGTQNWTVQSANGLAAVLLACGQDVAYVTECATGFLDFDVDSGGDLYASVTLPSLLVGTVGGGSGKGTARECLEILGCAGAGAANRFAEILAATILAGDLSLMAAFCSHEFVSAHERLGRNRPDGG
ncbi:MAG: 3-hydroxy-3-methylglutaryl-CoA reductase [bacterium]|nr:3-hydroxy-3-methylglutaryl-CoA reductase [bacterium]